MKKWVAFLDLLGTKESSKLSTEQYGFALTAFHDSFVKKSSLLSKNSHAYFFSDCAYVEIGGTVNDKMQFLKFINSARDHCFSRGYFFKAGVVPGELKAGDMSVHNLPNVRGHSFNSPAIIDAYGLQEKFKGIGICFAEKCVAELSEETGGDLGHFRFVRSWYLPNDRNTNPVAYIDLVLSPTFVGASTADSQGEYGPSEEVLRISHSFMKAKTKAARYGCYYIPLFSLLLSCADYSKVRVSSKGKFSSVPTVFGFLVLKGFITKQKSVPGFDWLLLKAFDCLLNGVGSAKNGSESMENAIAEFAKIIISSKATLGSLSSAPEFVVSLENRELLISKIADLGTK